MSVYIVSLFGLFLFAFGAVNHVLAQDVCSGILSYTGRDVVSEDRDNSVASDIFNQHCEGATAKRGSSNSVGLEAVVKAIPVKFNFGGSSNEEKLSSFCKVYSSRRSEFSSERIDRSTVVREALAAFNNCVELSTKGIYFNPKVGRTSFVVDVRRGSDDASITGVMYDESLVSCYLPPTGSNEASLANRNSVRVLDGNFLPIVCERKPAMAAGGGKSYPRVEVTIATSRGSLLLPIPEDSLMPQQWASQVQEELAKMAEDVKFLRRPTLLECTSRTNASGRQRYPQASARISADEKKAGFRVTGGGCRQIEPDKNFALIQSRPDGDEGWLCETGDLPGMPQNVQVEAYVVFCRMPQSGTPN